MSAKTDTQFSSSEFIAAIQKREPAPIERLVRHYTQQLLKACLGLGFDEHTSEEIVQRVWSTFFDVAPSFEGRSHVRTFLFGILYNKASEHRRALKKERRHDPIDEAMESRFKSDGHWQTPPIEPEKFVLATESLEMIHQCLNDLPTNQRMAFSLKEIDGEQSQEICNVLGVTVTNLGVLLYRARNKLRECIEKKAFS